MVRAYRGIQVPFNYLIKYRHPRTGAVGIVILHTAAEMATARSRLELLRYVVLDVVLPTGNRPQLPPISASAISI
jgi:hypothetical protein